MAKKKTSYAKALKAEMDRTGPRPKIADIATNFIREAGGAKNFGTMLWKEFADSDSGSLARQRILALVIQALKTEDDPFNSEALADLDDEDVERLLSEQVARLIKTGVFDGGEAPGTDAGAEKEDPSDQDHEAPQEGQGGETERVAQVPPEEEQGEGQGEDSGPDWLN